MLAHPPPEDRRSLLRGIQDTLPRTDSIFHFTTITHVKLTVSLVRTTIRQEREHAAVVEQRDDQQVPAARAMYCGSVRQLQARAVRPPG